MRTKIATLIASLGLVIALSGCGGDDNDIQSCRDHCDKNAECNDIDAESCKQSCEESAGGDGGEECSNAGEIRSHLDSCLDMDCDGYNNCLAETPMCE